MSGQEYEGFICPYCLVGFGCQGQLQNHFLEMHSGQGQVNLDDYDEVEYVETEQSPSSLGHMFRMSQFSRPRSCDVCSEIIWHEGLLCQLCQVTLHSDNCEDKLGTRCSSENNSVESSSLSSEREHSPPHPPIGLNKGLLNIVKTQVSKGRNRYQNEDFDLDLTYITEKIIAMSFPASGVLESAYRNNLKDVAKMLKTKHQNNYMVFNLSERSYDISRFNNQVLDFGWPDHLAPSLERLSSVCKSIRSWLDSEPLHVAVVHCKGGKGRTGCVIAAFMHYTEICHSAAAALDRFAMKRFYDSKCGGVTQPSQRKYVHYFADLLSGNININSPPVVLQYVLLHGIPNFDGKGGCRAFIKIYENMKLVHTSGLFICTDDNERIKISIYGGLLLQGEILVKCFHKRVHTGVDSIFRCQFPSAIVTEDLRLVYGKADLDDAFKDKRFMDHLKVELLFGEANDLDVEEVEALDVRSSLLDSKLHINGSTDLSHDLAANRDSYISFHGGYDQGLPIDHVPDLMGHDPPEISHRKFVPGSSDSFKMDPEDIERITHQSELYTVVNKSFKRGGSQREREPSQLQPQKAASDVHEVGLARSKLKMKYPSLESVDGAQSSQPTPPIHHQQQQPQQRPRFGGGRKDEKNHYPLPSRPLPPPHILHKQKSETEVLNCLASSPNSRPISSVMLDVKHRIDYDGFDKDDSPVSSEGSSPLDQAEGGGNNLPLVSKYLSKSHGEQDMQPFHQRPNKPIPAARHNKKQELHLKYTKIREQLMQKQASDETRATGGEGDGEGNSDNQIKRGVSPAQPRTHKKQLQHRPSYMEVDSDLEITVEPIPNLYGQSGLWGVVKYPTPKKGDSMGQRSSSSSNLTSSDFYSNLTDLELDIPSDSQHEWSGSDTRRRRSHSFSEGLDKMVITASRGSRDSIIDISSDHQFSDASLALDNGRLSNPDYKNIQYDEDGTLDLEQDESHSFSEHLRIFGGAVGMGDVPPSHNYENTKVKGRRGEGGGDSDYVNDMAMGQEHTYSNHDDLLLQMQADNLPQTEDSEKANSFMDSSQRLRLGSGASLFKFLKTSLLKTKQPTEIHSSSIMPTEGHGTLAPFILAGVNVKKVNKDYEAFKGSAWVDSLETPSSDVRDAQRSGVPVLTPHTTSVRSDEDRVEPQGGRGEERGGGRDRPNKFHPPPVAKQPRRKTNADVMREGSGRDDRNKPRPAGMPPPLPPVKKIPFMPPSSAGVGGVAGFHRQGTEHSGPSRPTIISTRHSPPFVPSSMSPALGNDIHNLTRPHTKLQASNSDSPAVSKPRLKDVDRARSTEPNVPRVKKPVPPRPPIPFHQPCSPGTPQLSETQVRILMHHWYCPKISREEAIELVLPRTPGSFIVRDSSTVKGGYALTIKITEAIVRHRKKMFSEGVVSDDMLVTHFLIQPDPMGVKLQGWNEKPFKSLTSFITSHVMEKSCLPCKLVLPDVLSSSSSSQFVRRQPGGVTKAIQSGAACDLVYLGSVDVPSAGSDILLGQTVQQLQSLDLSTMNIVTITVSRDGITLQESVNGSHLKRQYPFSLITYCGLDPTTRWNFPNLHHLGETVSLTDKICFGLVHRPQNMFGYSCMVFAEYDSNQPVSSVVNFIQKMMRAHRHSSKHNAKS